MAAIKCMAAPIASWANDSGAMPVATTTESAGPATAPNEASRVVRGFEPAPVSLDLAGKNRTLAGLSNYLVNAIGGRNDCHTNPPFAAGGNPIARETAKISTDGHLGGGTLFGPFIVSSDLTPDPGPACRGG